MAESLPVSKLAEYKDAFDICDKDGDGKITSEELGEVMRSLGFTPTEEEINAMIKDVDADGDGVIVFDEFISLMQQDAPERDILAAFNVFDKDKDGFITPDELKQVMTELGEEELTKDEIKQMIEEADIKFKRCYNLSKSKVNDAKDFKELQRLDQVTGEEVAVPKLPVLMPIGKPKAMLARKLKNAFKKKST